MQWIWGFTMYCQLCLYWHATKPSNIECSQQSMQQTTYSTAYIKLPKLVQCIFLYQAQAWILLSVVRHGNTSVQLGLPISCSSVKPMYYITTVWIVSTLCKLHLTGGLQSSHKGHAGLQSGFWPLIWNCSWEVERYCCACSQAALCISSGCWLQCHAMTTSCT